MRRQFRILALLISLVGYPLATNAAVEQPSKSDRHVLVVVWDGMRPDFVTQGITPTLWKLAREGVVFKNHHSVYPSATNVNGTAIVTGVYPSRNGILANHVYRPEFNAQEPIDVESQAVVEQGDLWSSGKYVGAPTIAEIVQEAGRTTAIATAKTVGLLLDRQFDSARRGKGTTVFAGVSVPPATAASLVKMLGPFPPANNAKDRDSWTVRALTESLWHNEIPAFSLLWLGEPDDTEHKTAPGSPPAIDAIKSSDRNLSLVLAALDQRKARATTDIFVVSDHGFSTISRSIDLRRVLSDAGFNVVTHFTGVAKPGDIMMVGNGGAVLFYVTQEDAPTISRLVDFLQRSDFAGVIFTKKQMEGTFALDRGRIDNPTAPDVVMAFKWTDPKNQFDVPGMIDADWQRGPGKGTHATLSPYDMHNTLVIAGPDFKTGLSTQLPSGNTDLAPTILRVLGIGAPQMDGRVLAEAMIKGDDRDLKPATETIEASRSFPRGSWRQHLKVSRVGSTVYLDEGNGEFVSAK